MLVYGSSRLYATLNGPPQCKHRCNQHICANRIGRCRTGAYEEGAVASGLAFWKGDEGSGAKGDALPGASFEEQLAIQAF